MKKVILMCLLCIGLKSHAQEWTMKINDPDFHNRRSKGLKIGDQMADIPLGSVWNNKTGKTHFSDFKGKLIILDFWSGSCASCIAAFPKMEKLQKEFKDEIQVFLINPWEKVDEVVEHFKKVKKEELKMPDLPCIQKDDNGNMERLKKLLPVIGVTTQVWINKDGKIALVGSNLNNTSKKIRDFLDGKDVFKLNNNSLNPIFDPTYPYVKLLGDFKTVSVTYGSTFTTFNNEYHALNSRDAKYVIDSAARTVRSTYVNCSILSMYEDLYKEAFLNQRVKIIYGSSGGALHKMISPYTIEIPRDTLRYTNSVLGWYEREQMDDSIYRKPKFCYEQILPLNTPKEIQKKYMQEDLNRYFGSLYGTYGSLEKRTIPCYILVKLEETPNVKIKNPVTKSSANRKKIQITKNGKRYIKYKDLWVSSLGLLIEDNESVRNEFLENRKQNKPIIFLNETGLVKIDLELPEPSSMKSMEDYRKSLNQNGFDVKIANRTLDYLVIKDNSGK